jgi:hypothetical protein
VYPVTTSRLQSSSTSFTGHSHPSNSHRSIHPLVPPGNDHPVLSIAGHHAPVTPGPTSVTASTFRGLVSPRLVLLRRHVQAQARVGQGSRPPRASLGASPPSSCPCAHPLLVGIGPLRTQPRAGRKRPFGKQGKWQCWYCCWCWRWAANVLCNRSGPQQSSDPLGLDFCAFFDTALYLVLSFFDDSVCLATWSWCSATVSGNRVITITSVDSTRLPRPATLVGSNLHPRRIRSDDPPVPPRRDFHRDALSPRFVRRIHRFIVIRRCRWAVTITNTAFRPRSDPREDAAIHHSDGTCA